MTVPRWYRSSYGQAALWFLWKLAPDSAAYNLVFPVQVLGDLAPEALERALQAVSDRHGCLRIAFQDEEGELRQRELENHRVELARIDARAWSSAELTAAVIARAHRPFDLAASAALAATLFERAPGEHVLVLAIHHIVSDLGSFVVMLEDLRELYRAEVTGRAGALAALPTTHERFVDDQRQLLAGDDGARQLAYWRQMLAGELPVLDLPTDRKRPPVQTFRGAAITRVIDADLTRQLKLLAGRASCTLFMALVAAYQVLLHRYTGQDDLVVGTPTSGRHRPELDSLVGYLVNMVALRGALGGAISFTALLRQVRERVLGAMAHQDFPFAALVDRLQIPRDLSRSPIFQTSFVLRQRSHRFEELGRMILPMAGEPAIPFGPIDLLPLPVPQQEGQFDLHLEMKENERGQLVGAWKYMTDLFDAETIERMAGHFETLVRALVAEPDRPVAELSLLSERERQAEIARALGPRVAMPDARSVVEIFEARAEEHGARRAIVSGDHEITYAELARDVRAAAGHLHALGARANDLVAVLLPRGIPFITWLLAANRAGAGFLPLNPRHPFARITKVLSAARTPIVISSRAVPMWDELCAFAAAHAIHVVDLDAAWPRELAPPAALPLGCDLAYAMFTSGSTGEPKGVLVEHAGMVNHVLAKLEDLGMGPDDVLGQTGPQSFDIIVWQCVAPLIQGGAVAVFSDAQAEDPAELIRETQRREVSVLQLVPSMLHALIDQVTSGDAPPLPSLRWMVPTGDALPVELCRRWLAAYPEIPLLNSYGSTECSDDQCHYEIRRVRAIDEPQAIASIGSPIRNMAAYVLDQSLAPVPVGVIGDLYIGGLGVGRGYLGDPKRTADAFGPDRFGDAPAGRLYRTGDRARRRADGQLDFLGRVDHMIKIRGFRIEPGEIEAALVAHPAISEAAVVARQHPSGERVLVAYVVPAASPPDGEAVRAFVRARLPQYMVPTLICPIPALPLSSNGKVDARALPAPGWEDPGTRERVPPRTPTEATIAQIWAEVLHLEAIGTTDDFFAIGGDSIRSIQIVTRCRRAGLALQPTDLFLYPTIAALAAHADPRSEPAPSIVPATSTYPLTPMQQGMLFHSLSGEANAVYVQQLSLALHGPLDVRAFTAAWKTVQDRHAVLRTAFAWEPAPIQIVGDDVPLPLEIVDRPLAALCADERARGFQLDRAPLFRLALVPLGATEHRLVWTWHHAILDAWSVPILLRELVDSYAAHVRGQRPALEPVRPFHDFVAWQRAQPSPEAWWRDTLRGFTEPTPLTIEHAARDPRSALGYGLEFLALSVDEIIALEVAARRLRVTLNTLAQGAWALLLSRYSRRRDVVFGTAVAGRPPEIDGIERMVGITLNTLPVRVELDPDRELAGWLAELQHQQSEARLREHVSLGQVQAWSEVPSGTPLFDSLLVFENFPLDLHSLAASELRLGAYDFVERASFPLTVMVEIRDAGKIGVGWNEDRFDRATMKRLLGHLRRLLAEMCAPAPRRLRDVREVGADEAAAILSFARGAHPLVGPAETLHARFFARAAATPTAPAIVFADDDGTQSITYGELAAQARAVRGRLIRLGTRHGARVIVSMHSSIARVATVLGVLAAGAGYVPVEPTTPLIRCREIHADSAAAWVIADPDSPLADFPGAIRVGPGFTRADGPSPEVEVGVDGLAYLIYTSGSTGQPKGVEVSHRSADHLVRAQIEAFQIDAASRVLQFASLSWDASVSEIFTALAAGACVVASARRRLVPSRDMVELLDRLGVTHATLPPSVLARLPAAPLPALRVLVSAGEPCSVDLVRTWAPGRLFLNAYGPTETTVCASLGPVDPTSDRPPPVGRPIGDARVYVLDDDRRPVPLGVIGELYVGGPGVARGYWGLPAQTAAAFVADPFAGGDARMYRTGDLARFLGDGQIEFAGRRDEQRKLRGFRIEPGEIEAVLRDDPAVTAAAIDVIGDGASARLIAWVVGTRDATGPAWWPSIAEYLVYDELAYHAMTSDERRNESYRQAVAETVRGRVVLEVGPGPEAILSRLCVEAGARKVYAVELLRDTFEQARARVHALGLDDVIEVIHSDATTVTLPEPADVCVSEIVGAIGGCEGSAVIMNGVRHLLAPGAQMIPTRSVTMFAPVELPAALLAELAFDDLPARYVERIFAEIGRPFDLRLSVAGLDYSHLLAVPRVFEDLDYRRAVDPESRHTEELEIRRDGTLHGFLVWLTLDCGAGPVLDILEHPHCWLPVFFPAFHPGVAVRAGDRISAHCRTELCEDRLHPDYAIDGTLHRHGAPPLAFLHDAPHHAPRFQASPFYAELFATSSIPRRPPAPRPRVQADAILRRLRTRLPEHMIPNEVRLVGELPLMDSGKLDRKALHGLGAPSARAITEHVAPRSDTEQLVAAIWRDLLGVERIGLRTNFFDEGGHSLQLIEVQDRLRKAGVEVRVTDLFKFPTVEALAGHLANASATDVRVEGAEHAAARRKALAARQNARSPR